MARVTTHPGFPRTVELYACGLGISKKNTVKNVLVWTIHDTFTPYTANHLEAPRKGHPHWHSCLPALPFLRQCICCRVLHRSMQMQDWRRLHKYWANRTRQTRLATAHAVPRTFFGLGNTNLTNKFTKENKLHQIQTTMTLMKLISKHFSQKSRSSQIWHRTPISQYPVCTS